MSNFVFALKKPKKALLALVVVSSIFFFIQLLDYIFGPNKARAVQLPVKSGNCLYYKNTFAKEKSALTDSSVCYVINTDGSFIEKEANIETPYGPNGLTNYSENNFNQLKMVPAFQGMGVLDRNIILKMKNHSRFYGPAKLKIGDIFYDRYPVKEFTTFNNNDVYVVEIRPDIDISLTGKSKIGKWFWNMIRKNKKVRTGPSRDVIQRRYYSRDSGILEGLEIYRIVRDINGNTISEDEADPRGKFTMTRFVK